MFKNNAILAIAALLILGFNAPVLADADTTAPVVNIALNPASPDGNFPWYLTAVDAGISATDDLDPAPAMFATVDQSPTFGGACDAMDFFGGGSILIDGTTSGAQGENYLHACAKDISGNMSAITDIQISLDTIAPVSSASAPATSGNATFPVQMNATEVTNPALGASLYVRKDGGAWQIDPATLNGTMGSYSFDFTPSGDGTYDFYTIATDDAGNTEVKPETVESTTVVSTAPGGDVTPPTTTLVMDAPDGNNGWYISQPVITFSVSDPDSNTANGSTLYCVDTTLTCTPNTIYSGPFQLPNGVHYVQFWSEDESTNSEAVQQYALNPVKVDESAPVSQSITLNSGNLFANDVITATLDAGTDEPVGDNSGLSMCEISYDGGAIWNNIDVAQTSVELPPQGEGLVDVKYRCTDEAGNVSADAADAITYDQTAPLITLIGDAVIGLTTGNPFSDAGVTVTDNFDPAPVLTTGGDTVNPNAAGTYVIQYTATDAAGNTSTLVTRTVNVTAASVSNNVSGPTGGGGGGGTSGGGGFVGNLPTPVAGQVLGASTINPELLQKLINLLKAYQLKANKGKVLGVMTANVKQNNHAQILNFLNTLKLRLATLR